MKIKNVFWKLTKRKNQSKELIDNEMKYLIVGLGNIGEKYMHTRHNIGFDVVDYLAKQKDTHFESARLAAKAEIKYRGRKLILIKPTTFMNLSGKAVRYWMQKENVPIKNLIIVVDDIALPVGKVRIKTKGGAGGHNGLSDIEQQLGTAAYNRMRIGIGKEFSTGHQVDFVLGKWDNDEQKIIAEKLSKINEAILSFAGIGIERTMNFFNEK